MVFPLLLSLGRSLLPYVLVVGLKPLRRLHLRTNLGPHSKAHSVPRRAVLRSVHLAPYLLVDGLGVLQSPRRLHSYLGVHELIIFGTLDLDILTALVMHLHRVHIRLIHLRLHFVLPPLSVVFLICVPLTLQFTELIS